MYVDPSGFSQMSVFDVLGYILSHWNSISSGTTYNFSGGYCTNFNNGLGTSWSSGGGGNSGFSFWGGWHKFHFSYTSLKGIFKVNGHASNTIWNFSIPTFNWGTLFNSGSSASWNEGGNSTNYENSSNNAGADIFDFSNFDGNNPLSGGVYNGQLVADFTLNNTKTYLRGSYGSYDDVRPVVMSPTKGKTHYDCTGWLSYVLNNTYPSLLKAIASNDSWGIGPTSEVEAYAKLNGGIGNTPHVGDIAIWGGHVEIVVSVDGTVFQTSGSSGRGGSLIPTTKTFNGTGDTSLGWYGNGTFLGFWTPVLP